MQVLFAAEIVSPRMGAERVVHGTAKALRKLGCSVTICDPRYVRIDEIGRPDIVHWFGTGSELESSINFIRNIARRGIPIVASSTLWPIRPDVINAAFEGIAVTPGEIATLMSHIRLLQHRQATVLSMAQIRIATSEGHAEMANQVLNDLGFQEMDFEIVNNAVSLDELEFFRIMDWEDRPLLVSCIARIEHWKNQRRLVKAAEALRSKKPIRLVLVGKSLIDLELPQWCDHVPEVSPFTAMLVASMSRVHALPSLGDFPGLANLEAAALGCQIVASNEKYSTITEYLPDVITVDPTNPASIALGLQEALATKPNPTWREIILTKFNYDVVASKLLDIYSRLL